MKSNVRLILLKGSLDQLRQVHRDTHSESHHSLKLLIGRVIERLEEIERDGVVDQDRIDHVLELLGKAFAALPSVLEFISSIGNG